MSTPNITVYFLGASRAIRIPWLLEELNVPYTLVSSPRSKAGVAPQEFKDKIPAPLKKSPTLTDGDDVTVQESGAIVQYLLDTYDKDHKLLPSAVAERCKVYEWVHAAEGTFMLHALAILYARWKIPEGAKEYLPEMEKNMSANVQNDLKWIESALKEQKERGNEFLVGKTLTAADIMMGFSIEFIFTRKLGTQGGNWPETEAWLARMLERSAYKKAVEKSGYTLDSKGEFRT
ncbi:hypothetical protein LTS08_004056 [Lithohypha guttulata]|uniref:uncharacterized protein n=1 Tax=Lithohypha guttulata TaxID=1690604 RepID=UPI002DE14C2C|nr:hypothetical protein LTR51_000987 [Lithohypha guttulata]KAK5103249.1 hypothetical protein LTS08_004056 [Lithohypha guttulata]